MAGNKNSGRRDKYNEVKVGVLADLSVNWAIRNWDKFSQEEKLKILVVLAPRYVPQKVDSTSTEEIVIKVQKADIEERVNHLFTERYNPNLTIPT